MFPLLLILLGAGLTAYSVSPSVKTRVDEFVRSIKGAEAAHQDADASLSRANEASAAALQAAQGATALVQQLWQTVTSPFTGQPSAPAVPPASSPDPQVQNATDIAVDYAAAAKQANRAAAKETANAAVNAETPEQRRAVAESANKVNQREQQITAALQSLGIGECDVRTYQRVTAQAKDALLARLHSEGMTVTGDNPWNIDTNEYDVKLRAVWDYRSNELKLIVTSKMLLVPCSEIWNRIDPKMKEIVGGWRSWR
jgi:hypothetical protein